LSKVTGCIAGRKAPSTPTFRLLVPVLC
jgi:hypothetical protein